jgi:hypothetical protein
MSVPALPRSPRPDVQFHILVYLVIYKQYNTTSVSICLVPFLPASVPLQTHLANPRLFLTFAMVSFSRNVWNPRFGSTGDPELGLERGDPLLPWPSARRYSRWTPEGVQLDDIPPIIKSANGNIFWADEQCTRRVGLTSTEARLFLRLLQVDEPEDWNYADYKEMFDNFGKEQLRLEQLMHHLPWWKTGARNQKKIWEARVEWLARMREPRPWLLFLMARRKRILKQATDRVLTGLRKKSDARSMAGVQSVVSMQRPFAADETSRDPLVVNGAGKSSDTLVDPKSLPMTEAFELPPEIYGTIQTAHTKPSTASKLKSVASRIQQILMAGHRGEHKHEEHSSLFPGGTHRPWEATREDIKRQVEKLMPVQKPYLVVGWFRRSASDPNERILLFDRPEQLFRILREGECEVRGGRGYFSLKSLQGFGLYRVSEARYVLFLSNDLLSVVRYCSRRAHTTRPDEFSEHNTIPVLSCIHSVAPTSRRHRGSFLAWLGAQEPQQQQEQSFRGGVFTSIDLRLVKLPPSKHYSHTAAVVPCHWRLVYERAG